MKSVVFFNHYHNGDLHVSRGLVIKTIDLIKKLYPNIDIIYTHKNKPDILQDINARYDGRLINKISPKSGSYIEGDQLFINTWYGSNNLEYLNKYGITFDCLYYLFDDVWKKLGADISKIDPKFLFPTIDYSSYKIDSVRNYISKHQSNKKVLVANADAQSGQATNFPMARIILDIAGKRPNVIFFISNKEQKCNFQTRDNVIYTPDIISKTIGSDLNENSYIGTFCDLIIGRSSGVFSFCYTQQNLFNRKVDMLCFKNPQSPVDWLGDSFRNKIKYSANFIESNDIQAKAVTNIIERYI